MINGIRNWIGDVASGKIKDAQIALTRQQAAAFQSELSVALNRIAELESNNEKLQSENAEMHSHIKQLQGLPKPMPKITYKSSGSTKNLEH
jgi:hypothetical protein